MASDGDPAPLPRTPWQAEHSFAKISCPSRISSDPLIEPSEQPDKRTQKKTGDC